MRDVCLALIGLIEFALRFVVVLVLTASVVGILMVMDEGTDSLVSLLTPTLWKKIK